MTFATVWFTASIHLSPPPLKVFPALAVWFVAKLVTDESVCFCQCLSPANGLCTYLLSVLMGMYILLHSVHYSFSLDLPLFSCSLRLCFLWSSVLMVLRSVFVTWQTLNDKITFEQNLTLVEMVHWQLFSVPVISVTVKPFPKNPPDFWEICIITKKTQHFWEIAEKEQWKEE